jgi:polyhydroxybutyrate depolymerase
MKRLMVCAITALSAVAPAAPASASACTRVPGPHTLPVTFQGREYPVDVYVPAGVRPGTRVPAVVNLHGTQSTGAGQLEYSNMKRVRHLVLAPTGVIPAGAGYGWNVPGVGTPPAGARDDIAFLDRVISTAVTTLCADPARVYGTGYSGGGRMISAYACARPERIAAIAPVAGLRAGRPDPGDMARPDPSSCTPERPVPVLAFHGDQDWTNPFAGGGSVYWGYSVPAALTRWARINRCAPRPRTTEITGQISKITYDSCRRGAEVTLYRIANGGHTWPGTPVDNGNGTVTHEIDANQLMWRFFQRHRR